MKKYLAIALYLAWGCILTWLLTFGVDIEREIILNLRTFMDAATHHVNITDVEIDLDLEESFLVEKYVFPTYTAVGDIEGDPGLKFETLDPEVIRSISDTEGYFRGARTEQYETTGRIRITSQYDLDFEKIVTVHFEKRYPQNFEARYMVKSDGALVKNAYVGVPIYAYMNVEPEEVYSERDYEVVYDPEYFKWVDAYTVVPIKETPEGEEISLTCVFGNGASAETKAFTIKPAPDTQVFDEIRLNGYNADEYEQKRVSTAWITLYYQGEKVITDYEVIAGNPDVVKLTSVGHIYYMEAGPQTFTIRLPNGFSKTVTVNVDDVMKFPTISGAAPNADGFVECVEGESLKFRYEFDEDVTYTTLSFEYDQTMLKVTGNSVGFTIKGVKVGETEFKVILDNGVQHFEETYKVKVIEDTSLLSYIKNNIADIVPKLGGHICGFLVLGLCAVNMLRFIKMKGRVKRFVFCSVCGLMFAVITEIFQLFMPFRTPLVTDIFIDMGGFYLGTLILLLFGFLNRKGKQSSERR